MKLVNSVHNTNRSNYLELLPYTYMNENTDNHKDLPSVDYKNKHYKECNSIGGFYCGPVTQSHKLILTEQP